MKLTNIQSAMTVQKTNHSGKHLCLPLKRPKELLIEYPERGSSIESKKLKVTSRLLKLRRKYITYLEIYQVVQKQFLFYL